jgi:feruloyl-CoA synthase
VSHALFAPAAVSVDRRSDGTITLRSPVALGAYEPNIALSLDRWAHSAPARTFLAERDGNRAWRRVTYGEAARAVASIAASLMYRGLSLERPVMVLSGNSVDHALLMLGCFKAGVPIVPVSPAYCLMSRDFAQVRDIAALIEPGVIYVEKPAPFQRALEAINAKDAEVASSLDRFLVSEPTGDSRVVDPDSVAKILFTSGSTGQPKAVINTHRMLTANQQMMLQCWPFLEHTPPVLLDWLPWNHTFGGNHDFNMVLRNGGTLYIDAGRPAPALIAETVRNLREVSPNIYLNVPAGFAMLLPYLEQDDALARSFLQDLKLIFYAGAALPQDLWRRLERLAIQHIGTPVAMTSAWGTTETAPMATSAHFQSDRAGIIGLPPPGVDIKLVPSGSKMELRVRGPNVTPGYFKRPDLTRAAFDEEGFYKTGDGGRFVDPDAPEKGLVFDGRAAEDFKLHTGTWVHVGSLRIAALAACSPVLQDAVVCGHDRAEIGILAWPIAGARDIEEVIRAGLARHNDENPGLSRRIARVLLMTEPPSIDANEITDKGYINQRAVLECRAAAVERLFREPIDPDVIVVVPSSRVSKVG